MRQYYKNFLKKYILKLLILNFSFLILVACGYKPSSHVIKNIFSDRIYVEVKVDKIEPENAPFIKDEINRIVYNRFKGRITTKEEATNQIRIDYAGSTFTPLAYENGYVIRYRVNVLVKFDMLTKKGRVKKNIYTVHEADIQSSSFTSATLRIEAIRRGVEKALDEFLAYISAKGMLTTVSSEA